MSVEWFPKMKSPFEREENEKGEYVINGEENDNYSWFREGSAVEKLDGTNCAVKVENGEVVNAWTRMGSGREMHEVDPYNTTNHKYVTRGIQNSNTRQYLDLLDDGIHYGELVGPTQGADENGDPNPYDLDEHLFIPFEWAREKLEYRSWGEHPQDLESISDWFKNGITSLFYCKMNGVDLETSSKKGYVEGVVFVHPNFDELDYKEGEYSKVITNMAKLRRDMFEWYDGYGHY